MSVAPAEQQMTTAAALISLKNELIEGGVEAETVDKILTNTAHILVTESGLGVRNA